MKLINAVAMLVLTMSFAGAAFAECHEAVVAQCDSYQITREVCPDSRWSFETERYSMIAKDGEKVPFKMGIDGVLSSLQTKKNIRYSLDISENKREASYTLTMLSSKAAPLKCQTMNSKAHAARDSGSMSRRAENEEEFDRR
jgi:hypothetical protein